MALERFYIFRRGATTDCAIAREKDSSRLPSTPASGNWQFWMQIGRLQAERGQYGFDMQGVVHDIAGKGYSLFAGSQLLLRERRSEPSTPKNTRPGHD